MYNKFKIKQSSKQKARGFPCFFSLLLDNYMKRCFMKKAKVPVETLIKVKSLLQESLPFYQYNKNYSSEYGDEGEEEVRLAKSEVYSIIVKAAKIYHILTKEEVGVEPWVQANISRASEALDSVYRHAMNDKGMKGVDENPQE